MAQHTIQVTILFQNPFWVGIFERQDASGYAVARQIFGTEPMDSELHEFVTLQYYLLKFAEPQKDIELVVNRKNYKKTIRDT